MTSLKEDSAALPVHSPRTNNMRCAKLAISAEKIIGGFVAVALFVATGQAPAFEPTGLDDVNFQVESTNVILRWRSDPREKFVILCRTNPVEETLWITLTNQMRASVSTNFTIYRDEGGLSRLPSHPENLKDYYRVFVVPDFWCDLSGIVLDGGPEGCGEDFLPVYHGTRDSGVLRPQLTLSVDGEGFSAEESIERVNIGDSKRPVWVYAHGFWVRHDLLRNGEHAFQLSSHMRLNGFVGGPWDQDLSVANGPVRVCVTNYISFPDWDDLILGDKSTFRAICSDRVVNWRFKVRDIHGQTLAEKQGRTLDGKIEWNWDLRDKKGVLHDTLEGDPYFESTITVWGDAEEKGSELLLQVARRQGKWWSRVLGRDYKRKQLSHAERERRFVTQEESPLESRVVVRPADLQNR